MVANFLREHFTNITTNREANTITIDFDGTIATLDWTTKVLKDQGDTHVLDCGV
jgi:hypothetical protein